MKLDRDEFLVTFDAGTTSVQAILDASESVGLPATVVEAAPNSEGDKLLNVALSRARLEKRPVVIDFTASWCEPCQRMLQETFSEPEVASLLEQFVFLKVDTDEHPQLAKEFDVVSLPDIRLLDSEGNEIRKLLDFQGPEAFSEVLNDLLRTNSNLEAGGTLVNLTNRERELKEAFNREAGHVRLLLILSPT